MNSPKGSIWRKWDLHVHTPETKLSDGYKSEKGEDVWDNFIDIIELSDVDAIGITDYFSCTNYFNFIERHKKLYPKSKKIFFPNVEFRLPTSVNKENEEINIHVIFSNDLSETELNDFLTSLKTNHTTKTEKRISCKSLKSNQYESATVNHIELIEALRENFGKSKPYLVFVAANNDGLRPLKSSQRKLRITDEIDKLSDGFFGGIQNVEYYLQNDRLEDKSFIKAKPVVCGCDAHSFNDLENLGKQKIIQIKGKKDQIVSNITWIKADLTFEGLKQIIYEPKHRVFIGPLSPRSPIRKLESIKFKFPTDTFIRNKNSDLKQELCINKLNSRIDFSDYFTCIIGGRGTGKSTIINILAETLNEKTSFFERSELLVGERPINIDDNNEYVEIEGTNEIEFVSQGRVEKLVEPDELTKLIFDERIKKSDSEFDLKERRKVNAQKKIDENIQLLLDLIEKRQNIRDSRKEHKTLSNIISSITDKRYIEINQEITALQSEMSKLSASEARYKKLLEELRGIPQNFVLNEPENEIDKRIEDLVNIVKNIDEINDTGSDVEINPKEFKEVKRRKEEIIANLAELSIQLHQFFKEKGTSEETIKDSENASNRLSEIDARIVAEKLAIREIKAKRSFNQDTIDSLLDLHKNTLKLIDVSLEKINKTLETTNENVMNISFGHEFNEVSYRIALFKEFYSIFYDYHIPGTSESRIKELLFLIPPKPNLLNMSYEDFMKRFSKKIENKGFRKESNFVTVLTNIFAQSINFTIYKLLIQKHFFNTTKYVRIKGFYGERPLDSCSFGQKCTAVIVTLLMTGVKPLIIDEPEAHLDNKLIADYLIELIKYKQLDRQIIFATHNSNFVINGDASLIHILEIPDTEIYTKKTSTTIEDLSQRDKLLKLEGGRDAFLNRESKYGI